MEISESFRGWLAGFTDGDGSIGIHKQRHNWRQGLIHTAYYVYVQFTNTDRRVFEVIQTAYGGNIPQPRPSEWGNYPVYHLGLAGKQAARLLRDVCPYLVLKKEHAILCLELIDTISKFKSYGPRIPESEWRHRELLYRQLIELNSRGKDRERAAILEMREVYEAPQPPLLFDNWGSFPLSDSQFRNVVKAVLIEREGVPHSLAEDISQHLLGKSHNIWDAIRVARLEPVLGVERAISLLIPVVRGHPQ